MIVIVPNPVIQKFHHFFFKRHFCLNIGVMVVMMVVTMVVIVVMVMTMLMIMNLLLSVSMRMLVAVIVMMGHKASFGSIGCVSFNRIRSYRFSFASHQAVSSKKNTVLQILYTSPVYGAQDRISPSIRVDFSAGFFESKN